MPDSLSLPPLSHFFRETAELLVKVEHDQAEAQVQEGIVSQDVAEANKVAAEVQVSAWYERDRQAPGL